MKNEMQLTQTASDVAGSLTPEDIEVKAVEELIPSDVHLTVSDIDAINDALQ
jgi:hypothetical protein